MISFLQLKKKIENGCWEFRLGIQTHGIHTSPFSSKEHIFYGTNSYAATRNVLKSLHLGPDDIFVDLGCGKGRVVCLAAQMPIKKVIGVDDDPAMCAFAVRNAETMKKRLAPISIDQKKAQDFEYTTGTVFYMFNPFGPETLGQILQKMKEGLALVSRRIRIVYSTPAEEDQLRGSGWLKEYDRWSPQTHPFVDDTVSFWTNHDA
jgi:cyclopropane fatty-acyl-phospholipid synthase-like methyltransferase